MEDIKYILEMSIPVYLMFCLLYKIYKGKRNLVIRDYVFEFIFVVYILSVLVLFEILPINISDFKSVSTTTSILPFLSKLDGAVNGLSDMFVVVLVNVLLFIPLGFLYPLIVRSKKSIVRNITLITIGVALTIEVMKHYTGRHFDVAPIIFKIIGALAGYYLYKLYMRLIKKNK